MKNKNIKKKKQIFFYINNTSLIYIYIYKSIILIFLVFYSIKLFLYEMKYIKKKRVGVVGLNNHNNIGNNLVKFSMFIKLKELGFKPIIIGITNKGDKISFLRKNVKLKEIIETFSELSKNDFDFLMVNSDQTWNNYSDYNFLDYGFLRFSQNWSIPKFVYGASLGCDYWKYSEKFDIIAKNLLNNFTGLSVRENYANIFLNNNL